MDKIHTNLYSRQISTYGMDIMLKIKNIKVIIIGMRGLGIEISKNIILSGIDEISIFDDNICKFSDLSSNFYISEVDINKKRRDKACIERLRDLNRETKINVFDNIEILKKNIKFFDIVVITEILQFQIINEINDICRENKKRFIYSSSLGISGFIFNDFGEEHTILNKTGRDPYSFLIKNITKKIGREND
jgi:ubiquitin-activating enzyme E1